MSDQAVNNVNLQLDSPFFTVLPAEIRNQIYAEVFQLTRLHILLVPSSSSSSSRDKWIFRPCLITPDAPDIRSEQYEKHHIAKTLERSLWVRRLKSEWCLHWPCEEAVNDPPVVGYLTFLTVCKRIYSESRPFLLPNATAVFTSTHEANAFLSNWTLKPSPRVPIQHLELSIRLSNIVTEVYYPPDTFVIIPPGGLPLAPGGAGDNAPPPIFGDMARPVVTRQNNPWKRLCDTLVDGIPPLRSLRIWLDTSDLRPWHQRVSETSLLGRLRDLEVADKPRFVLCLPELPDDFDPSFGQLGGHYLVGDKLEEWPFVVERGKRPNNWRVHLWHMSIRGSTERVQMLGRGGPLSGPLTAPSSGS